MLSLADILEALTGNRKSPPALQAEGNLRSSGAWGDALIISEAAIDSRLVIPGGLFVALPGERVDGHEFVNQALSQSGAHLALIDHAIETTYPVLDLRAGLCDLDQVKVQPMCLLVENSLQAMQKIAAFWRRLPLRA